MRMECTQSLSELGCSGQGGDASRKIFESMKDCNEVGIESQYRGSVEVSKNWLFEFMLWLNLSCPQELEQESNS